jgi:hypothetical protein
MSCRSDLALEILASLPKRAKGEFIFITRGEAAISGFSKAKIDNKIAELRVEKRLD